MRPTLKFFGSGHALLHFAVSPRLDHIIILFAALLLQIVYVVGIPLAYECDASAYYAFAKALCGAGGATSTYRGPLFPVLLIFSGAVWPGTFVFTVLIQAAFGVLAPWIFYRCLEGLGRMPALVGAFAFMVSTIPFAAAKLALAEQLFMFLMLLAVMFLARYYDRRDPRLIYGFLLAGLGAMFTRWEGAFLLAFGFAAIFILAFKRKHLRQALIAASLGLTFIASYSTARALLLSNLSLIGNLQNGTGGQLLWRVYSMPVGAGSVINPANGPATRELEKLVLDYVRTYPESYRSLKDNLGKIPPADRYTQLYGRFDGDPEAIVANIFNSPPNEITVYYQFYVTAVAINVLGLAASDWLLQRVVLEAMIAHPDTILVMLKDGISLIGIEPFNLYRSIQNRSLRSDWWAVFPYWGRFTYEAVGFDLGGCASNTLPPHMMAEYRFDQNLFSPAFNALVVDAGSYGRNLVRASIGAILIFGGWALFISQRWLFNLAVLGSLAAMIVIYGIAAGGVYSRYEYGAFPLALLLAVAALTQILRWVGAALKRTRGVPQSDFGTV